MAHPGDALRNQPCLRSETVGKPRTRYITRASNQLFSFAEVALVDARAPALAFVESVVACTVVHFDRDVTSGSFENTIFGISFIAGTNSSVDEGHHPAMS